MACYLYETCNTCGGDGVVTSTFPPGSCPCWQCGGSGKRVIGELPEVAVDLGVVKAVVGDVVAPVVTTDLPATKAGVLSMQADLTAFRAEFDLQLADVLDKIHKVKNKVEDVKDIVDLIWEKVNV